MAQYVVVRDCYALGRLWLKGEEVELAGVRVPSHFKEIKGTEAQIAERVASLMAMPADGDKDANAEQAADKAPGDDADKAGAALQEEANNLEMMDVFTLRKLALDAGIELEKYAKKTEIIAALRGE